MFNMASNSNIFESSKSSESSEELPLYEAKYFHMYDHRFGSYGFTGLKGKGGRGLPYTPLESYLDPNFSITPRYWINRKNIPLDESENRWLLVSRKFGRSSDERTYISCIIPASGVGDNAQIINLPSYDKKWYAVILANSNSFVVDFTTRQKLGAATINYHFIRQLAFLPISAYSKDLADFIILRVLELTYTAHDLTAFARDLGYGGGPFTWDDERRFWLRAELDALYFILYGIERADVEYIMETFPIVKRKDVAAHGSYRTKEAILSVFDELTALGLERLPEYRSRVPGGTVAGGWMPA